MLAVIRKKLEKSDLEKCSDAWIKFVNIKQEVDESAQCYVVRFEQVETLLKNSKIVLPERALAIHLLNRSTLEAQSKENVLTKTNLDDESEIYNSLKKSVREMKSALTQGSGDKKVDNKTYYTRDRSKSRNYYQKQSQRYNHSNRSFKSGNGRRHTDRYDRRNRSDSDRSWRNRSRS